MLKTVSTQLALASDTLPEVLAKGNTTGGTDLAVSAGDDITFADNSKAIFGAGSDLSIYSDGATGQVTGNVNVSGAATFSGNVGVGAAPTLWYGGASYNTIGVKDVTSGTLYGSGYSSGITTNAYIGAASGTDWKRGGASFAPSRAEHFNGAFSWYSAAAGAADSAISWVPRMTLDASGNLSTAGNVVLASGAGIDFSATAGTGTSELLDDYEEGTWTPTLEGGTVAGTYSIATTSAYYTKIGRQVTVKARIVITVTSAGTGAAKFGGLPFAKSGDQFIDGSVTTSLVTFNASVINVSAVSWTSGSSSDFGFAGIRSATSQSDLLVTDIADQAGISFTFTYFV